jgi:glycosyltransferase involved in cell wall biosynthesis
LVAQRLSVVIPALNEAGRIRAALEALAPLRGRGHEVIVADGGSTDGTPALAAPLCDRVVLRCAAGRADDAGARPQVAGAFSARGFLFPLPQKNFFRAKATWGV